MPEQPDLELTDLALIELLYKTLKHALQHDSRLHFSFDCDNDSGEIILTTTGGRELVISTYDVRDATDDN